LNSIPPTEGLWENCLNALRQICGDRAILPTTHVLSRRMIKRGNASMTVHDTDSCWEAQYKRRAIRVRGLQIPPAYDRAFAKKFCHEAALWRRLNHQNVGSVLGVIMDPYQVIFDQVSDRNIIQYTLGNEVDRASLIQGIAEGLGYLHSQSVVHGRLRGAAILVNDDGRAMLTDFGSCSVVWNPEDISLGIIRWCAPEVLGGDKVSVTRPTYASDVFSFGMVVLEIFSGKPPFDGISDDEVVKRIRSGERPDRPAWSANLGLSDALWGLVQKCWNGSPEFRPGAEGILEYTRKIRPTLTTEYSEAPTFTVNPSVVPKVKGWKRFSNFMGNLFGSSQVRRGYASTGWRVKH